MELTCPKCQSPMRQYERNSVTVDQCGECRGIFLDRGELEKLIDAEAGYYDSQPAQQPAQPQQPVQPQQPAATQPYPQYQQPAYPQQGYHYGSPGSPGSPNHWGGNRYGHQRRRKSFLSELFD